MIKKLYISRRISGSGGRLDYYLTERAEKGYGVEIHKVTSDGEIVQSEGVKDISLHREKVLEFIYMLSDMEVMPVHLEDIVKDFVDDDFFILNENMEKTA